jgi:hypothetical protein
MTGYDTIQELRNEANKHENQLRMYNEIADLADYLNELENVEYSDVSDAKGTVFITVHCKEVTGTISDMIKDYKIFGNGETKDGLTEFVFEVQPRHFED